MQLKLRYDDMESEALRLKDVLSSRNKELSLVSSDVREREKETALLKDRLAEQVCVYVYTCMYVCICIMHVYHVCMFVYM